MNKAQFHDGEVRPTLMSQAEANELMELWAERQREGSHRHAMVTVHDVAEATQMPLEEVEKLLQEVRTRSTGPIPTKVSVPKTARPNENMTLGQAYERLAPTTAFLAAAYFLLTLHYFSGIPFGWQLRTTAHPYALIYAMGVLIWMWIRKRTKEAKLTRMGS